MGKRGPPPLPTAVKKARGTLQRCREAPNALELPPELPEPPIPLDKAARERWDYMMRIEEWRVVLSRGDGDGLALLCKHLVMHDALVDEALRSPMIKTRWGPKPHPAAAAARKEADIVRHMLQEFGLTPSARTRVSVPDRGDKKKADTASFLFGGLQALPGGKP